MELNFVSLLVLSVLFMICRTSSAVSLFTMFSPLLPRNTSSAMTYEPIFSSTIGFCMVEAKVALLPPT